MLTPRQRVISALSGQPTDRLVWAPIIDDYYLSYLASAGRPMDAVSCLKSVGADVIARHAPFCRWRFTGGVEKRDVTANGTIRTEITTPVGSLAQTARVIDGSFTVLEFLIKSREDIKIYQYVEEHKAVEPDYEAFAKADAAVGDAGTATVSAPATPLATIFENFTGLSNFVYFLADYPDEMNALMALMHENHKKENRVAAQSPSPAVFIYEDTSTTTISKELYRKYCKDQIDDYADIVHGEGKPFFVHMCGKLKGFADVIAPGKMDGLDSVCPPETGDVQPWDAPGLFGGKLIIGGIDPSRLCLASPPEIGELARETILRVKDGGKVILCTGDATAAGTPMGNLRLVAELVNKYGRRENGIKNT
ncbi:MAG: uroporphyrinogen decarboxylase family protein [Firmicutes bacterium]|nr:uroporphyrinogen decarboxylase family protein [Bacillota bacterium]